MLDPHERQDLFAILRPPDGYQLDQAIGTTFSLDLLTLLTVPLAFTIHSGAGEDANFRRDPLALMDGVRRYAKRILIFCQAGQIAIPQANQQLFSYLENQIFEVAPLFNEQAVFHPKVWLLRYQPTGDKLSEQPIHYRFLCLSRNLTFDRSWDTSLVLDGLLIDRKNAYSRNHPLGNFFAQLPNLLIRPQTLPDSSASVVDQLQDEVRRVDFQLPIGFDDLTFMSLGLTRQKTRPFPDKAKRQLVVSPFVSARFLKEHGAASKNNILVSRLDSLMSLTDDQLQSYQHVYVMNDEANPEDEDQDDDQDDLTMVVPPPPPEASADTLLSGLHAKLFICEHGWDATIWTGSANATMAAFNRNVEFLVQLTGKKSHVGIDKFLSSGKDGRVGFLDLLISFDPQTNPVKQDPQLKKLDLEATRIQRLLARLALRAEITTYESDPKQERFAIHIIREDQQQIDLPNHVSLQCWPITLQEVQAVQVKIDDPELAVFKPLSFAALTSFFAFEVTAVKGRLHRTKRFVISVPLHNIPADRQERILRSLLDNQDKVIRYLFFLLAGEGDNISALIDSFDSPGQTNTRGSSNSLLPLKGTLFEALIRTLNQHPEKLDTIAHLVSDMEKAKPNDLLPEGFHDIWLPIWQARQNLQLQNKNSVNSDDR